MARKTLIITIPDDNRDKGKNYILTEMSTTLADQWAVRALLAVSRSGVEMPDTFGDNSLKAIATTVLKIIAGIKFEEAQWLQAELMSCVQIQPNPSNPNIVRKLVEDDIEEVKTRLYLQFKALELNIGSSWAQLKALMEGSAAE